MPVYLLCPHCNHPQIVPQHRRGTGRFCRQCGKAYLTSRVTDDVYALPISSIAELRSHFGGRRKQRPNIYDLVA